MLRANWRLFTNSGELNESAMQRHASAIPIDAATFKACLETDKFKSEIQKDSADAAALQISGTPTFVVGRTSNDSLEGILVVGAQPYQSFESAIKQFLP